ncbi:MAG TPA: hypothetical protein VFN10_04690 [Thermoanaerobaculia bacterium]|nr:hypothetical protein [Thermoanaerobaculia bacterium]
MHDAQQTSNPIRLLDLGWKIKDALDEALKLEPDNTEVRLDLVRYYVMTPAVFGGGLDHAREEAAEIARRDAALGHFANGYIAYRDKALGLARNEFRDAIRLAQTPATKTLALRWMGWLSQESQQYATAFETFEQLRANDASANYEIGRTAVFCTCELERGETALKSYIAAKRTAEMPSLADARYMLGLLYEKKGDRAAARREVEIAYRLDRTIAGVKEARERLGTPARPAR